MEAYPKEVQGHPLLLASLVGATALHPSLTDALHEAAVNACGHRRFKYLSSSYDMRILPAKRGGRDQPNYRWEGVLKRSWLEKMCNTIPAVLVLCIDWSEELDQPEQEESQALHYLQHVRRQAKERDLRLVVFVLLHPKISDPEAATRCLHSAESGGAPSPAVVAVGREDLNAKAPSLERLIYQNAMAFYADEEKRLRRAWAPKTPKPAMQAAMQVRTNFKVAFLNEFRKDARGALTAYVKAYEVLMKESEVIDVLERLDLCNHIALRMYNRYFNSHDVGAAVHHCRVHVNSLKKTCPESSEYVWRKWHWLSLNHQIFGDLLDTMMQRVPLLIDNGDMWQFPGFHFQLAAVYARRLREWAVRCLEPGHLPPDRDAGGQVVPSAFLGQAGHLERPTEVESPREALALRLAWQEARKHNDHAERSLKLLIRAQAAAKERTLGSWITSSQIRVAEAYLCDQGTSHQEAARDLFQRLRKQSSSWAPFQRFFLERSLLCSCTQLGLPVPALCSSTRAVPAVLEPPVLGGTPSDELRSSLVRDALEYLTLKVAPAWHDPRQGQELLDLLKQAAEPLPEASIEIALPLGRLTSELLDFTCTFDSSQLAVPLQLLQCSTVETGESETMATLPLDVTWEVGQPLLVRNVPSAKVHQLRCTWAVTPAVVFVGEVRPPKAAESSGSSARGAELKLRLPGEHQEGLPERLLPPVRRSEMKLISELLFPVDPAKALVSDTFLFYLTLRPPAATATPSQLRLVISFQVEDQFMDSPSAVMLPLESSKAPRVSLIEAPSWQLLQVGEDHIIAELGRDGLQPAASLVCFQPGQMKKPGHPDAFAWPLAVQCGRACKMTLSCSLQSSNGSASDTLFANLQFQHAMRLQASEERLAAALAASRPMQFSLKSLAPVETSSVTVLLDDEETSHKCLGQTGLMATGSAHAFLWRATRAAMSPSATPRLRVEFRRHKALESFFQWIPASQRGSAELRVPGGAVAEWLLPVDPDAVAIAEPLVELEANSTSTVGLPLKVRVKVRNDGDRAEEVRIRILQEGEVSDRYLLSGPVTFQTLAPPSKSETVEVQGFSLIPLKPGWLSLPRVQVLWPHQEVIGAASAATFVSPSRQPALERSTR